MKKVHRGEKKFFDIPAKSIHIAVMISDHLPAVAADRKR